MQPIAGTHTSAGAHASSSPLSRQMPAAHVGATQEVTLSQSVPRVHSGRGHDGSEPVTQLGDTHSPPTQVSLSPHTTSVQLRARTTFTR